jgi:hypothetical protein
MLHWLREYLLFLVKAGHLAAMVRAIDGRAGADGIGQVGHAIDTVQRSFRDMRVALDIDRLSRGAVRALIAAEGARSLQMASATLPASFVTIGLRAGLGFAHEVILAAVLRAPARNPWREARDAVVLFAQNHVLLLKAAATVATVMYGIALLAFLMALLPANALAHNFPGDPVVITFILAAIFAWSAKQALLEPVAVAALLQVFIRETGGQPPDPAWDLRLADTSAHFRELTALVTVGRARKRAA